IIQQINDVAFKLNLPKTLKIHLAFHVSLLKPKDPNNILIPTPPTPCYYGLLIMNITNDATNDVAQATPQNYATRTSTLNSKVCL
ncbi:hypothetical protein HK096_000078, partial [Nowakowskiella sp. JEL0078]